MIRHGTKIVVQDVEDAFYRLRSISFSLHFFFNHLNPILTFLKFVSLLQPLFFILFFITFPVQNCPYLIRKSTSDAHEDEERTFNQLLQLLRFIDLNLRLSHLFRQMPVPVAFVYHH